MSNSNNIIFTINIGIQGMNVDQSDELKIKLSLSLSEFLQALGITEPLRLHIYPEKDNPILPIVLFMNGRYCPYPDEYLSQAMCYADKRPHYEGIDLTKWWVDKAESPSQRTDFLNHLLQHVMADHLPSLITPHSPLADLVPRDGENPESDKIKHLTNCKALLEKGIGISAARIRTAMDTILENSNPDGLYLQEALIAALSRPNLELHLNDVYLNSLLYDLPSKPNLKSPFEVIQEKFFLESGVSIPAFEIKIDRNLPYGAFRLLVNDFNIVQAYGIHPQTRLYDLPQQDRIKTTTIEASGVLEVSHPLTGQVIYQISDPAKEEELIKRFLNLRSINALEYIALCCKAALDQRLHWLINTNLIDNYLKIMRGRFSRTYVKTILTKLSLPLLTNTLRVLHKEGFSLRHFQQIIELLLEADCIPLDPEQYLNDADRRVLTKADLVVPWWQNPSNLAQYVRKNMSTYIVEKKLPLKKVGKAIKIEQDIVNLLKIDGEPTPEVQTQILQCIEQKLAQLLPFNQEPIVFHTYGHIRSRFAELSRYRFPQIPVMLSQELQHVRVRNEDKDSISL